MPSAAWLTAKLQQSEGANLVGLWLGADPLVSGGWVGRVGGTLAAGSADHHVTAIVDGVWAVTNPNTAEQKYLVHGSITWRTAVIVSTSPALPFDASTGYAIGAQSLSAVKYVVVGAAGTSNLYTADNSHVIDGVASDAVPTTPGYHIFQGSSAASTTGIHVHGGTSGVGRYWSGAMAVVTLLAAPPSAEVAAVDLALLRRHVRIA